MQTQSEKKARALREQLRALGLPRSQKKVEIIKRVPSPFKTKTDYQALQVKDGKTPIKGVDYFTAAEVEDIVTRVAALLSSRNADVVIEDHIEVTPEIVKKIVQEMKKLPETERLEIQDIRNAQQFIFNKNKYSISELMHGGGSTSSGLSVTTQYLLTAVQSGSDVTIDLSQLDFYADFSAIICLYRNNVPQTEGASYNFTQSGATVTVYNADASEVFNITYSYTA